MTNALQVIKWATPEDLRTKRGIIYRITNVVNGKSYIGKSINTFKERYGLNFIKTKSKENYYFNSDAIKQNYSNFKVEILVENVKNEDCLLFLEKYFSILFNSLRPNGYNIIPCGEKCPARTKTIILRDKYENIVQITNISKYCKENNLNKSCLRKVLNKEWLQYKGFHLPYLTLSECKKVAHFNKTKIYLLKNPQNKIVLINNLKKFCKENYLCENGIRGLISKQYKSYKGWTLPETDISKIPICSSKPCIFHTKSGEEIFIQNLREYCKINNLSYDIMKRLRSGKISEYKNFINKKSKNPPYKTSIKTYYFLSPKKEITIVNNLAKFSKENNLSENMLRWVQSNRVMEYKGWTKYINT